MVFSLKDNVLRSILGSPDRSDTSNSYQKLVFDTRTDCRSSFIVCFYCLLLSGCCWLSVSLFYFWQWNFVALMLLRCQMCCWGSLSAWWNISALVLKLIFIDLFVYPIQTFIPGCVKRVIMCTKNEMVCRDCKHILLLFSVECVVRFFKILHLFASKSDVYCSDCDN